MTSGCTASRTSIAGACLGALGTESAVPDEWVNLTAKSAEVSKLIDQLLELRQELQCSAQSTTLQSAAAQPIAPGVGMSFRNATKR